MSNEQANYETEQMKAWIEGRIRAYDRTVIRFMIHHFPDKFPFDPMSGVFPLSPLQWEQEDDKRLKEEEDIRTSINVLRKAGYEVLTRGNGPV